MSKAHAVQLATTFRGGVVEYQGAAESSDNDRFARLISMGVLSAGRMIRALRRIFINLMRGRHDTY